MQRRIVLAVMSAIALVLLPWSAQARPLVPPTDRATGWYLALGDSLAAGYQPGQGDDKTGGYVGGVLDAMHAAGQKTKLTNLACSGETVVTMVDGGRCAYDEGTQLDQALEFLHAHGKFTRLITIDIGANDVQRCVTRDPLGIDTGCLTQGMQEVGTLLPKVLGELHAAAPQAQVVVLDYYDPFLAAYLLGPAGQALASESLTLLHQLNAVIAGAAASVGADVADVAGAFHSDDWSTVSVPGLGSTPRNVATICQLTWMCLLFDIHANDSGYAVMAGAVVARL